LPSSAPRRGSRARSAGSGVRSARRSKRNSFLGPATEAASHGLSRTPSASSRRSSITPRFRTCSGSPGQPSVIARRLVGEHLHEDRFDNLRAIGVDEFGFAAHHRYLTLVIDHDRQRVIWAAEGKSSETLAAFFDELGPERRASIEFVSIDMAAGYIKAIQDALPQATIVFDRFHVARLAQDAVTAVRRAQARQLDPDDRAPIKNTRWALLKNPENLRASEKVKLDIVRKSNNALYRAYLLKETFLDIFTYRSPYYARRAAEAWIAWAQRSRLAPFVRLARTVRKYLDGILAFIHSRLTNARLEGMNTRLASSPTAPSASTLPSHSSP
jgi:transposase